MLPSGSDEPEASKFTLSGASPDVGEALKLALGGWLAGRTVTLVVSVSETPELLLTVSLNVSNVSAPSTSGAVKLALALSASTRITVGLPPVCSHW